MGWHEIRTAARRNVHQQFALPAFYSTADLAVIEQPISVRLHNDLKKFGDLDREGFARVMETVNQIIFDSDEVVPVRNATVTFRFDGQADLVYNIDLPLPSPDGGQFIRAEVTRVIP
jgi:hypothetical protein